MPRVNFKYDFKKDAWSWVYIIGKKKDTYGYSWEKQVGFAPKHLLEKILKYDRRSAELLVRKYLISNSQRLVRQLAINKQLKALEEVWRKIESKYFKRLEKITQKPIFTKDFGCYLTTGYMCPYNDKENWFMVSIWHNILMDITTICHEIFHLQFLHYYENHCRKFLSEQQKEDLKEAITFILNTDFDDLILNKDSGYPNHKELRRKLEKIWHNRENFQEFLDKAIKIIKTNIKPE